MVFLSTYMIQFLRKESDLYNIYENVKSPCVKLCQLDLEKQVCTGCFRTIGEITNWSFMNPIEKKNVLGKLDKRKKDYLDESGLTG